MARLREGIEIGKSPAGVEWRCYHDDPEMVEKMKKNLARRWHRHAQQRSEETVKVTGLTSNQRFWLEDELTLWEGSGLEDIDVEFTKTTATGPRKFFTGCLERLEGKLAHDGELLDPCEAHTHRCKTEAEYEFAERQYTRSIKSMIRKLKKVE